MSSVADANTGGPRKSAAQATSLTSGVACFQEQASPRQGAVRACAILKMDLQSIGLDILARHEDVDVQLVRPEEAAEHQIHLPNSLIIEIHAADVTFASSVLDESIKLGMHGKSRPARWE